jgi:hypothetical protein
MPYLPTLQKVDFVKYIGTTLCFLHENIATFCYFYMISGPKNQKLIQKRRRYYGTLPCIIKPSKTGLLWYYRCFGIYIKCTFYPDIKIGYQTMFVIYNNTFNCKIKSLQRGQQPLVKRHCTYILYYIGFEDVCL